MDNVPASPGFLGRKIKIRCLIAEASATLSQSDFANCILLAAIPLVMSIINTGWLYSRLLWLDPWMNVGYFLHYSDPTFGNSFYKIARLSWIIPGFIVYHVFQPIVANYLLHICCLILSVVFFYLTATRLFGRSIAFTTAACLAAFLPFHASGGFDYQNTPAGTYYFVAFYLLTSTLSSSNVRVRLTGAGAAYAAALHATVGFVNTAPILAFHCIILHWQKFGRLPSRRFVLSGVFWFLIGGVALTLFLGLVNLTVGRDFLFFRQLWEIVITRVRDSQGQATWWIPLSSSWLTDMNYMRYLGLPSATLVGCILCVSIAIFGPRANPLALSLQLQYIFLGFLWIVWQALGQTALQPDHFAYPLYPAMFFALAAVAANWQALPSRRRDDFPLYLLLSVVLIIPLAASAGDYLYRRPHFAALIIFGLSLLSVALLAANRGRVVLALAGVLAFSGMNSLLAAIEAGRDYALVDPCGDRAGVFEALVHSDLVLSPLVRNTSDMYIWWNQNEVLHDRAGCKMQMWAFAESLTSLGLFGYLAPPWRWLGGRLEQGMPQVRELPQTSLSALTGETKIAVLTADDSNVQTLLARLRQEGLNAGIVGRTIIRTSRFSFDLYVLALEPPQ